jgi:hypothetical protein
MDSTPAFGTRHALIPSVTNKAPEWRANPSRNYATGATRKKYEKAFESGSYDRLSRNPFLRK